MSRAGKRNASKLPAPPVMAISRWRPLPVFSLMRRPQPRSTLFPYTTLFRSAKRGRIIRAARHYLARHNLDQTCRFDRSEEHTSELQSQSNLVCRLLLEKKNTSRVAYTP